MSAKPPARSLKFERRFPLGNLDEPSAIERYLDCFQGQSFEGRHPIGIYSRALQNIVGVFNRLLDALPTAETLSSKAAVPNTEDRDPSATQSVEKLVADLFLATEAFLVDLTFIVSAFAKLHGDPAFTQLTKNYASRMKTAREFIALPANKIKHEQSNVVLIRVNSILGFYVDGVDKDGALGPHLQVHPEGDPAFSFNRAIRQVLASLIYASDVVVETLSAEFPAAIPAEVGLGPLAPLALRVAGLSTEVFFDEAQRATTFVTTESALKIAAPNHGEFVVTKSPAYVQHGFIAYKGLRKIRLPYEAMKGPPPKTPDIPK